jgi:hypothetical protein
MFGYVMINEQELRVREVSLYRSYYCGLCEDLLASYGRAGQLTLNYDTTFLAFLLTCLYEPAQERRTETVCIAHPFKKHQSRRNIYTQYAADMTILLARYSLQDDWEDEKKLRGLVLSPLLGSAFREASARWPQKADSIRACLDRLHALETGQQCSAAAREVSPDEAGACFGDLMAELFAFTNDAWELPLRHMGFYLGKFIYLLDAYDDLDKDEKSGSFNPLLPVRARMMEDAAAMERRAGQDHDARPAHSDHADAAPAGRLFDDYVRTLLTMLMASCTRAFEALPIVENIDILRNILYAGIWTRFNQIYAQRTGAGKADEPAIAETETTGPKAETSGAAGENPEVKADTAGTSDGGASAADNDQTGT